MYWVHWEIFQVNKANAVCPNVPKLTFPCIDGGVFSIAQTTESLNKSVQQSSLSNLPIKNRSV